MGTGYTKLDRMGTGYTGLDPMGQTIQLRRESEIYGTPCIFR